MEGRKSGGRLISWLTAVSRQGRRWTAASTKNVDWNRTKSTIAPSLYSSCQTIYVRTSIKQLNPSQPRVAKGKGLRSSQDCLNKTRRPINHPVDLQNYCTSDTDMTVPVVWWTLERLSILWTLHNSYNFTSLSRKWKLNQWPLETLKAWKLIKYR